MASSSEVIVLDRGLDYTVPPLLAKSGTLFDARNYEITADIGYRKIDGFERTDDWPNGSITRFFEVTVAPNPDPLANIAPGYIIVEAETSVTPTRYIGIVLSVNTTTGVMRYAPFNQNHTLSVGNRLFITSTASSGAPPNGLYSVTTPSVDGKTLITDPTTYLDTLYDYQEALRSFVIPSTPPIAGVHYSRDRTFEVVNTMFIKVYDSIGVVPHANEVVRFRGKRWIFVGARFPSDPDPNFKGEWHFIPTDINATPNNNDIVSISLGGGTKASNQTGTFTDVDSWYAYPVYRRNPQQIINENSIDYARSRVRVPPVHTFRFTAGKAATEEGPSLSFVASPATQYYVREAGGGGVVFIGELYSVSSDGSSSWVNGVATGRMQLRVAQPGAVRDFVLAGDEVYLGSAITPANKVATVGAAGSIESPLLAGTAALRANHTRYQFGTYNFYGHQTYKQLYGTNGVYRAFWIDSNGLAYGNIYTQDNAALDNPKYLAFHAGVQLGLGFDGGSVQLSVGGKPYDFEAFRGALEISTGDDVTGMLEAVNDSTLVFGPRSIHRVTGTTDNTLALETVVPNAGCFDYTAVNVGTTPVFTGPNGITTLDQSDAYGDFVGQRLSATVHNWLNPKLVPDMSVIEKGGVACAFPVRDKGQYRLFLNTGDVVSVAFTSDGAKVMRSDYAIPNVDAPRVPLAWTSQVSDTGKEVIQVVWDRQLAKDSKPTLSLPPENMTYELDEGWGFDGNWFPHWFSIAWLFPTQGYTNTSVSKVRLHGQSYGQATLTLRAAGIEDDYNQEFDSGYQDISLPSTPELLYDELKPVTCIIDQSNWGLGIKLKIEGRQLDATPHQDIEPSHICQVMQVYYEPGVNDN